MVVEETQPTMLERVVQVFVEGHVKARARRVLVEARER